MGKFVKGDVVVVPFPFSDLTSSKKRPALVLCNLPGDDVILCQITSKLRSDKYAIELFSGDFRSGSLTHDSYIRPNRIFTADKSIILYKVGSAKAEKIKEVRNQIVALLDK